MEQERSNASAYEKPYMPRVYDAVAATIFSPFGGLNTLRNRALDMIGITKGMRVLEPGCGTGGVTRLLLARGADVCAVDGAGTMLAAARLRAAGAHFEQQQLEALKPSGRFDLVLFSFVLHELPAHMRAAALTAAAAALGAGGRMAVLDHAVPAKAGLAKLWRGMLMRLEPPSVAHCIERGYDAELVNAGLRIVSHHALAGGTAMLTLAQRSMEK